MMRSDVEQFFENWNDLVRKVFEWRREFLPNEYVLILKEGDKYKLDEDFSTEVIEYKDRDALMKLIEKEELVFIKSEYGSLVDLVDMKTNGCDCGSFATRNSNLHSPICRLYGK